MYVVCAQALNAALEVFVCSSSSAEACYRVQLLQTLSQVLWNSPYRSVVLAWMKVLNRVSTQPTHFNGDHNSLWCKCLYSIQKSTFAICILPAIPSCP